MGVPPEGKPVSMTREPPEEYREQTESVLNRLLIGRCRTIDVFAAHQSPLPPSFTVSEEFTG